MMVFPEQLSPPRGGAAQRHREESTSFLKKRSKRLLFCRRSHNRGHSLDLSAGARIKVFLLLFLQKKKAFPFLRQEPSR
jgi:hypothetical protein